MRSFCFLILVSAAVFSLSAQEKRPVESGMDPASSGPGNKAEKQAPSDKTNEMAPAQKKDEPTQNDKQNNGETTNDKSGGKDKDLKSPSDEGNKTTEVAKPEPAKNPEPVEEALPENWLDGFRWKALLRMRPEFHGNYDFDKTRDDVSEYIGHKKIQLGFEKDFMDDMTANVVLQDSRLWGGQPGSRTGINTANDTSDERTDIRTAWFEARNLGPLDLRVGRQLFKLGDERLIGSADWSNVGRSFDGMMLRLNLSWYSANVFGAVLAEEDSDSGGNGTRVGVSNASGFTFTCDSTTTICTVRARTTREQGDAYMGGLYNTFAIGDFAQLEAYYIGVYKKWIQRTTPILTGGDIMSKDHTRQRDNLQTIGGRLTNRMGPEKKSRWEFPLDWSMEYAWQSGPTGRTIDASWDYLQQSIPGPQGSVRVYKEKEHYDAFGATGDIGYTFVRMFRLGSAYSLGSGDANRGDGVVGTFSNLFPSNHGAFGQADLVSWQNIRASSVNATVMLGKYGKVKLAAWDIRKHRLQDGWYDGTGTIKTLESTEALNDSVLAPAQDASGYRAAPFLRRHLFKEYDFTYIFNFRRLEIGLGYSRVQAQDAISDVKNDNLNFGTNRRMRFDPRADFAYLMMTLSF